MRGDGGGAVEVVGDVDADRGEPDRMQKIGSADRERAGSGARVGSGTELLIPYPGYSIELLYIYI